MTQIFEILTKNSLPHKHFIFMISYWQRDILVCRSTSAWYTHTRADACSCKYVLQYARKNMCMKPTPKHVQIMPLPVKSHRMLPASINKTHCNFLLMTSRDIMRFCECIFFSIFPLFAMSIIIAIVLWVAGALNQKNNCC